MQFARNHLWRFSERVSRVHLKDDIAGHSSDEWVELFRRVSEIKRLVGV